MSEFDFKAGMSVVVRRPPTREAEDEFSGIWVGGMGKYDGETGTIRQVSPRKNYAGVKHYSIAFEDGVSFWWDERFMEPESLTSVTDEEFDSVLEA